MWRYATCLPLRPNVSQYAQAAVLPSGDDGLSSPRLGFRREARMWSLYIEDAEREVKEEMDVWRAGLDSRLVGLFAGIISSFIIDARRDVQSDSEQNLLGGIWNTLRQPAAATEDVHAPASARWIYLLWLLSLQFTVFSAVLSAVARDRLHDFAPVGIMPNASGACHCRGRRRTDDDEVDEDDDEVLARVLADLIKSPKSEHINEAAAEIALPSFNPKSIARLCRDECSSHLLSGLKRYVSPGITRTDSDLIEAGCLVTETGSASDCQWAGAVTKEKQEAAEHLVQKFLVRLFDVVIEGWEDSASIELSNPSSSATVGVELGASASPSSTGPRVLDHLVSSLSHPDREVRSQNTTMLVARLAEDRLLSYAPFTDASIESISKMVVYEDEDHGRDNALKLLEEMATNDESKRSIVTSALLANCGFGFKKGLAEQQMGAIDFVRTLSNRPDSPLYSLVGKLIPNLVDLTLGATKTETRGAAMNVVNHLWTEPGFRPQIEKAMISTFKSDDSGISSPREEKRYRILMNLLQHFEKVRAEDSSELAWGTEEFLRGVTAGLFEGIVGVAIHDSDRSAHEEARRILKHFVRNEHLKKAPNAVGLGWLNKAESSQPGSWRTRNNAVLVSEMFMEQLDISVELLEKLLIWAGRDTDINVRRSSLKLVSSICKGRLEVQMINALTTTIASLKDSIIHEPSFIRTEWISFLRDLVKSHAPFADAVEIMLEVGAVDSDFDILDLDLPKSQSEDNSLSAENASRSEYGEAVKGALKQSLELIRQVQDPHQLSKMSELVKFLFDLSGTPGLQNIAKEILKDIANVIKNSIQREPDLLAYASKSPPKEFTGFSLKETTPFECLGWIYLAAILAAAGLYESLPSHTDTTRPAPVTPDFDVATIIFGIAVASGNQVLGVKDKIATKIDIFLDDKKYISEVRIAYIQLLLATLGSHGHCDTPEEVLNKLAQTALSDQDQEVRLEALNVFSTLARQRRDTEPVQNVIKFENFASGVTHSNWRMRQAWIKFASTQIKDASSPFLSTLLDVSIVDVETIIRKEVIKTLQLLMQSKDAGDREHVAAKLGQVLSSRLAAPDSARLAVSVLATITTSDTELEENILCQGPSVVWIELILFLSQVSSDKPPISRKVIETAIEEKEVRDALDLFHKRVVLPKALDSALDLKSDEKTHVRAAAIRLFCHLKGLQCSEHCKWHEQPQESLVSNIDDEKIISRLANLAIKSGDKDLRQCALRLLKEAFVAADRLSHLRRPIKASLQKVIEHSLKDHEFRASALDVIDDLTDDPRIETLSISDDVASSIAGSLASLLRHISPLARAITLELLLRLYTKHGRSEPFTIDSAIPEIVALALDDKNSEIWVPAMSLLIALSSPPTSVASNVECTDEQGRNSVTKTSYDFVLSQIKSHMAKFMASLEFEDKRPLVVELLSSVSLGTAVRRSISLHIASKVFAIGSTNLPEGHVQLLCRLVSDGRFEDQATDFMMLSLAHTLVSTNPHHPQYLPEILTALWCRYGSKPLQANVSALGELGKWFTFALFGRHATLNEVNIWNKRCESWLGDEKMTDSPIEGP
ncbi:hypothetical protein EST38_g8160 [Candolleomyces aberdarensis]|uniref:DUF6535 domain-containing protein n=1 Tax=Candolleomyces aberdarensis TaxID=2316362 RepID=A0A4Q2DDC2_9AGAR|nr:hypothetical protein EST38_g8160 [Candolleomyces aberdarensis]